MRNEAVEMAVRRSAGCCCTTDSRPPTTAPTPPARAEKHSLASAGEFTGGLHGGWAARRLAAGGRRLAASSGGKLQACARSPATVSLVMMRSCQPATSVQRVRPHKSGMVGGQAQNSQIVASNDFLSTCSKTARHRLHARFA